MIPSILTRHIPYYSSIEMTYPGSFRDSNVPATDVATILWEKFKYTFGKKKVTSACRDTCLDNHRGKGSKVVTSCSLYVHS